MGFTHPSAFEDPYQGSVEEYDEDRPYQVYKIPEKKLSLNKINTNI